MTSSVSEPYSYYNRKHNIFYKGFEVLLIDIIVKVLNLQPKMNFVLDSRENGMIIGRAMLRNRYVMVITLLILIFILLYSLNAKCGKQVRKLSVIQTIPLGINADGSL